MMNFNENQKAARPNHSATNRLAEPDCGNRFPSLSWRPRNKAKQRKVISNEIKSAHCYEASAYFSLSTLRPFEQNYC